jgi:hypothetical protein
MKGFLSQIHDGATAARKDALTSQHRLHTNIGFFKALASQFGTIEIFHALADISERKRCILLSVSSR